MASHPNRSKRTTDDPARRPQPDDIRETRARASLSAYEASRLIYVTETAWRLFESGERAMHPGLWELFCLKLNALTQRRAAR